MPFVCTIIVLTLTLILLTLRSSLGTPELDYQVNMSSNFVPFDAQTSKHKLCKQ